MERVEGETIAPQLLRDDEYANAREVMTAQLGAILATIHRIPSTRPASSPPRSARGHVARARPRLDRFEQLPTARITPDPHPAFELAFPLAARARCPRRASVTPRPRRLPHRQRHLRAGGRARHPRLGAGAHRRPDGGLRLASACAPGASATTPSPPAASAPAKSSGPPTRRPADAGRPGSRTLLGGVRQPALGHHLHQPGEHLPQRKRPQAPPPGSALELAAIGRRTAETEWELLNLTEGNQQ